MSILRGENDLKSQYTLENALLRYVRDESPKKRGVSWEVKQANRFIRDYNIVKLRLGEIINDDFAKWRDRRLREVSPSTVRREMIFLSSVLDTAMKGWGWIDKTPLKGVKKPSYSPH